MPFASSPVTVSPGDTIELRYPTPPTWNTNVTFNIQIGEGTDSVTVGTKLPDAQPDFINFNDQSASISQLPGPGDFVSTIQKNTFYYSNSVLVSGIELRVPIRISSSASGPKGTYPNLANSAAFRINDSGPWINEADSFQPFTFSCTSGSRVITVSSTAGLAVGKYIISGPITGEILQIVGNSVTVVEPASTTNGSASGNAYFTVQAGQTVRLRVQTEDWYTTNSNVTLTLSDNYWSVGDQVQDTWSITTRAQEQVISTLNALTLFDYVDVQAADFDTFIQTSVDIIGIDDDTVLRANSSDQMEISDDNVSWSQSLDTLTLGDTLYIRTRVGADYTTKTSGVVNVFAQFPDTAPGGFENNGPGTYGTGVFEVTQSLGSNTDSQRIWTEVDRYPDPISLSPIFAYSDQVPLLEPFQPGQGYVVNQIYTTTNQTTPAATGLTIRVLSVGAQGELLTFEVVERGSNYLENDVLLVNGGLIDGFITITQYRKVVVSSQTTLPNAEPNRYYFSDIPISGLGVEYPAGAYDDRKPDSRIINSGQAGTPSYDTSDPELDGSVVQIQVQVTQGNAEIRKNDSGTWTNLLYVTNTDTLNLRMLSNANFDTSIFSSIQFQGPPDAGPAGNPTQGPTSPVPTDLADTITLVTREPRIFPNKFRALPDLDGQPEAFSTAVIPLDGIDGPTSIFVVGSQTTVGANASVSTDDVNYGLSRPISVNDNVAYVRIEAGLPGEVRQVTYRIGTSTNFVQDRFIVLTPKQDYFYNYFDTPGFQGFVLPDYADTVDVYAAGAGGGRGGDDLPASFGGIGGPGNILIGELITDSSFWPNPFTHWVGINVGAGGEDGVNFDQGAAGGAGGIGYASGGNGGNAAASEYSGGGGGGGGATALILLDATGNNEISPILVAGGGGGGGGAGADTTIPTDDQDGNRGLGGGTFQPAGTINLVGANGTTNLVQGGGGGGAGGGWGTPGDTNTEKLDSFGEIIGTTDLDAQGGTSGQYYYVPEFVQNTDNLIPSENGAGPGQDGFLLLGYPPQDTEPDPFSFTAVDGREPSEFVESEIVQITGITGFVATNVTGSAPSVLIRASSDINDLINDLEPWTSTLLIENNQYLQVQLQTGLQYFLTYTAEVTVGTGTPVLWFVQNGPPPDTNPSAFAFTDVLDAEPNTFIESEVVTIGGINTTVKVTASGGAEIRVGVFDAGTGTVVFGPWVSSDPGDPVANQADIQNTNRLQVRILSSPNFSTTLTTDVVVGGSNPVEWNVRTKDEPDLEPDTLTFIPLIDQDPLTEVFSNINTITGISEDIVLSVDNGALWEVNFVQTGLSTVTVSEFDQVRLYYTTSAVPGELVTFTVSAGDSDPDPQWVVVNSGDFGTTPNPFTFGVETTPDPSVFVDSVTVTINDPADPPPPVIDPNGVSIFGNNNVLLNINGTGFNLYTSTSPFTGAGASGAPITIVARLLSPAFPGFSNVATITVGSGFGTFTVFTTAPAQEPLLGQWYSSLNTVISDGVNPPTKFNTKFDGVPVGTLMPVFKENFDETNVAYGNLDGSPISRFPGFVYCDGQLLDPEEYPALFSVIGTTYGAQIVPATQFNTRIYSPDPNADPNFPEYDIGDQKLLFRLPDLRNKKVVGTGPIDGQRLSSPALAPEFGPAKNNLNRSVNTPGSHGGLWFIDQIDSPQDNVIPQVDEPPAGQEAIDSFFFDIGTIRTSGYENVTSSIEFITTGEATGAISLKETSLFEVPFHVHEMISGVPDPGTRGRVYWNGFGGVPGRFATDTSPAGGSSPASTSYTVQINLWGYAVTQGNAPDFSSPGVVMTENDTILTSNDSEAEWIREIGQWDDDDCDGVIAGPPVGPGFEGPIIEEAWPTVLLQQTGLDVGSGNYNEINSFINIDTVPIGGVITNIGGDNAYKWIGAIDVPTRTVAVEQFRPLERLDHTHYLTEGTINDVSTTFSRGNVNGAGISEGGAPTTLTVDVVFAADDIGLEVLPGLFTLDASKQLIPTPSLAPQETVGLITPYVWAKWMIKAY